MQDHVEWLDRQGLTGAISNAHEGTFVGVLCGTLLNPAIQDLLLAPLKLRGEVVEVLVDAHPVDIVIRLRQPNGEITAAAIEVKGYKTKSNMPGYRGVNYALWQTDRMHALAAGYDLCSCGYEEACRAHGCPVCKRVIAGTPKLRGVPQWWTEDLEGKVDKFVLLDFEGRDMSEAFSNPRGLCSDAWSPIGHADLGRAIRKEYEELLASRNGDSEGSRAKASALVPLLVTLFADKRF